MDHSPIPIDTFPPDRGKVVSFYIGEAILSRSSGAVVTVGGGFDQYEWKTELITTNIAWSVPKALNQEFSVRIFGGGSGVKLGGNDICIIQYWRKV